MDKINWIEEANNYLNLSNECEEAYDALESFIDLYLFNEIDGKSAMFTDYDNSVNDAIFDSEYDALESSAMTRFDRLGGTDHANNISKFRIEAWIERLESVYAKSVERNKKQPIKSSDVIECTTSLEEVAQDFNILQKVTKKVKESAVKIGKYDSSVNNNDALNKRAQYVVQLSNYLDSALSVVSSTGSTTRSPKNIRKPTKLKTVALNRIGLSKKTMLTLRNETPKFIAILKRYTMLMDEMTRLVDSVAYIKDNNKHLSKSDYKQFKADLKEKKVESSKRAELKYARKATKNITKDVMSISRYLKVLMALEMQKLEMLTALYLKVNKKM